MNDTHSDIVVRQYDKRAVVSPGASITCQNTAAILKRLDGLIDSGIVTIEINLKSVFFIDSAGLEFLLDLKDRMDRATGKLMLSDLNKNCQDILIATQLINEFNVISKKDITSSVRENKDPPWE